jgi:hypothetical protein
MAPADAAALFDLAVSLPIAAITDHETDGRLTLTIEMQARHADM